ncbi:hypothetical protein GCM10022204_23080 [Microlunatus aurantiacus]|uniref:VWA7 N-terminal domain-containing protein n=1 Tax=Microlunatus aurantiacus TaxID=446786 RepID=A0ABP7DIX8_9ACTN
MTFHEGPAQLANRHGDCTLSAGRRTKHWAVRVVVIGAVVSTLVTSVSAGTSAHAFALEFHEEITYQGLGSSVPASTVTSPFVREPLLSVIDAQHDWMDKGFPSARRGDDEKHFDDCEFDGSAEFIRDRYAGTLAKLDAYDVWGAATDFGRGLHPVQDFYSHSNWVELGFPRSDNPRTGAVEVAVSDLVDLSGSSRSLDQTWFAPAGGAVVRDDILLGGDDWDAIPGDWSIERNGAGRFVPVLLDAKGSPRGRLLETGESKGLFGTRIFADSECDVTSWRWPPSDAYTGIKHENLNKDSPTSGASDVPVAERRLKHARAKALATLQTGYEWCRLVRDARRVNRDGLLVSMWVKAGGNPHPPGTPCRQAVPGPQAVTVTIESVRIIHAGDSDGTAGEVQLAAVLYDDPQNFRRSVHTTNRGGRVSIVDGSFIPRGQLPGPMTLCLPKGTRTSFTLHAWDNDDAAGEPFSDEFDNAGDDPDDIIQGVRRDFGDQLPVGVQVAESSDLQVSYRVSRTAGAATACPLESKQ